jgi:hypothetical protein
VAEERARLADIDARPIKKVVEAKARKKMRISRAMERAKSAAGKVAEQEDMSAGARMREIQRIYAKAQVRPLPTRPVAYAASCIMCRTLHHASCTLRAYTARSVRSSVTAGSNGVTVNRNNRRRWARPRAARRGKAAERSRTACVARRIGTAPTRRTGRHWTDG